jgi:hypothetical protein
MDLTAEEYLNICRAHSKSKTTVQFSKKTTFTVTGHVNIDKSIAFLPRVKTLFQTSLDITRSPIITLNNIEILGNLIISNCLNLEKVSQVKIHNNTTIESCPNLKKLQLKAYNDVVLMHTPGTCVLNLKCYGLAYIQYIEQSPTFALSTKFKQDVTIRHNKEKNAKKDIYNLIPLFEKCGYNVKIKILNKIMEHKDYRIADKLPKEELKIIAKTIQDTPPDQTTPKNTAILEFILRLEEIKADTIKTALKIKQGIEAIPKI